tara:strand:- start:418 stop:1518 length:1101 start_codon:yes stop_codon:yes gene_type:complete
MSRVTIYVIKEISSSFLFSSILLTGILWLGQSLRHLDLLTTDNVEISAYFSYVFLLLPKIFQLTTPIALFISILFVLNRLRSDSELIVLWASGKSNKNILIKPIIIFSSMIFIFMITLSIFITPYSLNEIRHKIIDIRSSGIHSGILKERKFISPVDTLTIFLQEINGDKISGLLIHDLKDPNNPNTYIAEKGRLVVEKKNKFLRLYNGSIQIFNKENKKISEIAFESYDLNLSPYQKKEDVWIYADELKTSTIIKRIREKDYDNEQFAELNNRFINPIYLFCLALLPLLVFKLSKRPDESWLIPIIVISIIGFSIKIIEIGMSNLLVENNSYFLLNYSVPIIIMTLILLLLINENKNLTRISNVF